MGRDAVEPYPIRQTRVMYVLVSSRKLDFRRSLEQRLVIEPTARPLSLNVLIKMVLTK